MSDCVHCGLAVRETHVHELVAGGGWRVVTILVHDRSGHERCAGRETVAGTCMHPGKYCPAGRCDCGCDRCTDAQCDGLDALDWADS